MTNAIEFLGLPEFFAKDLMYSNIFEPRFMRECDAWYQAAELGIVLGDKSVYECTAEQAAQVLEAIADGRIAISED
jgi:hypothetical protein